MLDVFGEWAEEIDLFVLSQDCIQQLTGFHFHRGVLASGRRPSLLDFSSRDFQNSTQPELWCGLPNLSMDSNLGSMVRSAACFELSGLVIRSNGVDPFSRRAIRASMGSCFQIPLYQSDFTEPQLETLKQSVHIVGLTRGNNSLPLPEFQFPQQSIVMMGHEHDGLPTEVQAHCHSLVEIPMNAAIDSLNVSVAASIVFYHWHQQCRPRQNDENVRQNK